MERRGFSLVEFLIVLAIFGLLLGLGVLALKQSRSDASSRGLARSLAQEFLWARQRARATGSPVGVCFPSDAGTAPYCQSVYMVEGSLLPRITRVVNYQGDFPTSVLFVGYWALDPSQLSDSTLLNTVTPPAQAIRSEAFDASTWGLPRPQDPCFVFLPSGAVVSNRQVMFDGAYHLLACEGLTVASGSVGGAAVFRPVEVGDCSTVAVSPGGDVRVHSGIVAENGSIPRLQRVALTAPPARPPALSSGANQDPAIAGVEVFPLPNPATLPAGVDATVDLQGYLTMHVRATDPDGDPLSCQWTCADGTHCSAQPVSMAWDGTAWDAVWEWRPPLGAPVGSVFTLQCQVSDGRGGVAVGDLGAAGRVEVIGGGKITFSSTRDGSWDIFLMNPDGSEVTNLTRTPGTNEYQSVWSPDGTRLAYLSDGQGTKTYQLWTMGKDGSSPRQVTTSGTRCGNPCWMADGTRLTYSKWGTGETWMINADGSDNHLFYNSPGDVSVETCWQADGARGLVARLQGAVGAQEDVILLNPDGTAAGNLTQLTGDDESPTISPDGTRVAWSTTRTGDYEVFMADFDGTQLLNLDNVSDDNNANDGVASWSPDGQQLVFYSDRDGNREIYLSDLAGTLQRLTNHPAADAYPNWGP